MAGLRWPARQVVLEHYYRELLRYFTRRSGDAETAADVVQESYARVLTLQGKGVAILEPRALLYQAGRNVLLNQVARRTAEGRMLETLALISADTSPCAERHASAREQLERLLRWLERMPRKRRHAFILVRIHGFSYAEAAQHMEVSVIAIERHLTRALLDFAHHAHI